MSVRPGVAEEPVPITEGEDMARKRKEAPKTFGSTLVQRMRKDENEGARSFSLAMRVASSGGVRPNGWQRAAMVA